MTITVWSSITEVSDNTTNGHTIKQRVHMRAGNPALACTLCFCLPAKPNFVFCQQSDHFKIMRNTSEQPPNFTPSRPNFRTVKLSSGQRIIFHNNEPYSQQKKSNRCRKVCEQKKTKIKMVFYRYNTRLCAAY